MMPGAMHSVDVVMSNPGLSLVQCRVADHISAGEAAGGHLGGQLWACEDNCGSCEGSCGSCEGSCGTLEDSPAIGTAAGCLTGRHQGTCTPP